MSDGQSAKALTEKADHYVQVAQEIVEEQNTVDYGTHLSSNKLKLAELNLQLAQVLYGKADRLRKELKTPYSLG